MATEIVIVFENELVTRSIMVGVGTTACSSRRSISFRNSVLIQVKHSVLMLEAFVVGIWMFSYVVFYVAMSSLAADDR